MNLDEYDSVQRQKILVYGEPKSGKTALVGGLAAAGFKLWWFDLENGIKTLRNPEVLAPEFRKNVSVFNIPDNKVLPVALDQIRKLFKGGKHKFCHLHGISGCPVCAKVAGNVWSEEINLAEFGDNDILVIDSFTQLAESAINKVMVKEWLKDEDYKPSWDDWAQQGNYLKEILSKIQTSNIHTCVISHDIDTEKDEKKVKIVPVGGTRNASNQMGKYFDEVVYVQRMNKRHIAYSSSLWNNTHLTGGRSGVKLEEGNGKTLADVFRAGNLGRVKA